MQELLRYKVHHSYIWLGTIRALLAILAVIVVTQLSSIEALFDYGMEDFGASSGLAIAAMLGIGAIALLLIGGIILLVHWLAYKNLYFTIGPDEFTLHSGIISKKAVHVPYSRVQSVDQRSTLFMRIFGLCNVSIDTAGGASNKAVLVPYLTKSQAQWLRGELYGRKQQLFAQESGSGSDAGIPASAATAATLSRTGHAQASPDPALPMQRQNASANLGADSKNVLDIGKEAWDGVGGVFAGQPTFEIPASFEYGLSNKELILSALSSTTSFVMAALVLLGFLLQVLSGIMGSTMLPPYLQQAGSGLMNYIIGQGAAFAAFAFITCAVVIWVVSLIGSCLNYGGFRACRRGTRIEVEHGLLQHAFQGIDIQRVQSVVIKQTLIRRLLGYCEISISKVDASLEGDASSNKKGPELGVVLHPFVKLDKAAGILMGIIPEYNGIPQDPRALPKVARRRAIIRKCVLQGGGFWTLVGALALQAVVSLAFAEMGSSGMLADGLYIADGSLEDLEMVGAMQILIWLAYVVAVILFAFDLLGAILWSKESSFACNSGFMQVTNSGLTRSTVNFPRNKIQFASWKRNPLQAHAGTATLRARTAAGVGGTTITLVDVGYEDAMRWLDWVSPNGAKAFES